MPRSCLPTPPGTTLSMRGAVRLAARYPGTARSRWIVVDIGPTSGIGFCLPNLALFPLGSIKLPLWCDLCPILRLCKPKQRLFPAFSSLSASPGASAFRRACLPRHAVEPEHREASRVKTGVVMNVRKSTRMVRLMGPTLGLLLTVWAPAAVALTATLTAAVHLRAGPSIEYPSVAMIPAGTPVEVFGCEAGYNWCDVQIGADRGWVDAVFLQAPAPNGPLVIANSAVVLGIPTVSFAFNTYWGNYYVGRPWYSRRDRYFDYWNRYPHGRPPPTYRPPAPRPPVRPPSGVRPPPRPPGNARPPAGGRPPPGSGKPPGGSKPPGSGKPPAGDRPPKDRDRPGQTIAARGPEVLHEVFVE
jgi:uncharacterized protein YraI